MIALALLLAAAIEYPAPLKQFVGAVGKDGKPVLTQGQLHTLDGLPEHTRELLSTAIDNQIIGSSNVATVVRGWTFSIGHSSLTCTLCFQFSIGTRLDQL